LQTPVTNVWEFRRTSIPRTHKPCVAGSNPAAATKTLACTSQKSGASLAKRVRGALGMHPFLHPFALLAIIGFAEELMTVSTAPSSSANSARLRARLTLMGAQFSLSGRHFSFRRYSSVGSVPMHMAPCGPSLLLPGIQGLTSSPWFTAISTAIPARARTGL
jgi:hypothetical protein